MTLLSWFALFVVGTSIGSLVSPLLRNRFPLSIMHGSPGEARVLLFPRVLFGSLLFGGTFGLLCGSAILAVRFLLAHLFSK
jgi:hypothetical protein